MYSRVAICKTCQTRVLDEQLNMTAFGHPDKCIYCLLTYLQEEIVKVTRKRDDYFFSFQMLEFSYSEVHAAYEAAVKDNFEKYKELSSLRLELLNHQKKFKVDPNRLIG